MKRVHLGVLLAAATTIAFAQVTPEDHAAHHEDAAPAAQDHFAAMKSLMEKLKTTKDPAERKRLLGEHHQAMRQQLDAMRHMNCGMEVSSIDGSKDADKAAHGQGGMMAGGGMMPGGGTMAGGAMMAGGGTMGGGAMMAGGGMMKCHEMMQTRMNMMIEMMDQMLEHEDAEHAPPAKKR